MGTAVKCGSASCCRRNANPSITGIFISSSTTQGSWRRICSSRLDAIRRGHCVVTRGVQEQLQQPSHGLVVIHDQDLWHSYFVGRRPINRQQRKMAQRAPSASPFCHQGRRRSPRRRPPRPDARRSRWRRSPEGGWEPCRCLAITSRQLSLLWISSASHTPPLPALRPLSSATPRPLSACGFVPLATVARWLRRRGITALNGPLEALHRREMVIDILDLTGGSVLEPRGRPWGKRRQCPAVRPHGTPAERTTSRLLLVSQSPSLTS